MGIIEVDTFRKSRSAEVFSATPEVGANLDMGEHLRGRSVLRQRVFVEIGHQFLAVFDATRRLRVLVRDDVPVERDAEPNEHAHRRYDDQRTYPTGDLETNLREDGDLEVGIGKHQIRNDITIAVSYVYINTLYLYI